MNALKTFSVALSAAFGLSACWPGPIAAYCLDGVDIGMFTEREFTELESPPRSKTQDKRLNALLKRGMQATGANLVSVDGASKDDALEAAASQGLVALAYLELEAVSEQSALPGPIVDIASTAVLQILAPGDGRVLGEGSDNDDTPGTDIEDALDDILNGKKVGKLAEQAEKAACKNGLSSGEPVLAAAERAPAAAKPSAADRALITTIQHGLIAAGYDPGLPDGLMGHKTGEAIRQAEMKLELPPTGEPSSLLAHKLAFLDRSLINNVQQALYDLGRLDSRPSRVLDGETQREIEDAEYEFDLDPKDGLPDSDLLRVLRAKAAGGSEAEATAERSDEAVDDPGLRKRIEELLVQLDYFKGPASGIATIDSEEAIWAAERDFGLEADGIPDKELWRLLSAKAGG